MLVNIFGHIRIEVVQAFLGTERLHSSSSLGYSFMGRTRMLHRGLGVVKETTCKYAATASQGPSLECSNMYIKGSISLSGEAGFRTDIQRFVSSKEGEMTMEG